METVIHKASQRGFANHGWLKAAHSFSFANYYDNEKVHFGLLRVLNDDIVAPSRGFDLHPHQDMEIITIPLSGSLLHSDNMGHREVIKAGEVQVMSAGTGIVHSEYNASDKDELNLFQIWILTNKKGHKPRYDQKKFSEKDCSDEWQLLVGPEGKTDQLWINQDAYISVIQAVNKEYFKYHLKSQQNGVYFMMEDGYSKISEHSLGRRDAAGFWNIKEPLEIHLKKDSKLFAIEVPMK